MPNKSVDTTRVTLHSIWAMSGLAAFLILVGGAVALVRPDGAGAIIVGLAAIATPVLMGLLQMVRQQQLHVEIKDNTEKTEQIRDIVNGERTAMAAQIQELERQNRALRDAAMKIESAVISPPGGK